MNLTAMFESALDELMTRIHGVLVVVSNGHRGAGAGIFAGDGLVLTNNHVAGNGHALQVTLDDGGSYKAQVVKRNAEADLALLQLPNTAIRRQYSRPRNRDRVRWCSLTDIRGASAMC